MEIMDTNLIMAFNRIRKEAANAICFLIENETGTLSQIAAARGIEIHNMYAQLKKLNNHGIVVKVKTGNKVNYVLADKWQELLIQWDGKE